MTSASRGSGGGRHVHNVGCGSALHNRSCASGTVGRVTSAVPAFERDLVLLLEACTARVDVEVLQAVRAAAGSVRHADGYVFQHLLDGPITPTELARRLGVSQQAASKQVADMAEPRGSWCAAPTRTTRAAGW